MASRNELDVKQYCNTLYSELNDFKGKLNTFIGRIDNFQGEDKEHVGSHAGHLREIIKTIDWKLEIIGKACPLDTETFAKGAVEGASVPLEEVGERNKRAAGGDIGG